jgi:2-keto-4-pentenoate hydratase/2-oxohepta-3-ene-1,7-dioic acid hydratase in catechol pathway/NAD(P)-dependent dehydrogenase (short-subunit alcohol dehydrogenase family)
MKIHTEAIFFESSLPYISIYPKDHCTEQNVPIPEEPLVFSKFGDCIIGPDMPVAKDEQTEKLDYEVELGVVIGTSVPRYTSKDDVHKYVGGFTVVHDVSARYVFHKNLNPFMTWLFWFFVLVSSQLMILFVHNIAFNPTRDWQLEKNGGQWQLGKSMDGYAPIGPVIVTTDELSLDAVHKTGIRCRVNGELLQDSNTEQLVFGVDDIIAFVSRFVTLRTGDVIATGTPPGVGCFRNPPRWLVPGDVVECEIDGIGTLSSPIVGPLAKSGPEHARSNAALSVRPASVTGRLSGKTTTCIVTGGARGIGYGIAARLGMEGATRIAIVDLDPSSIEAACKTLHELAPNCHYFGEACDVGNDRAVYETWGKIATSNGGRIDVLIQAAGIVGETGLKTENVDPDNFDAVFRVNVRGIFNGCKAVLPYMRENKYGRIVNISSIAGKEGNAGMLAYSASKAAVIGLTKTIGKEYAEMGITCNALSPAVVRTQMVEDMPPEQVKYMTDKIPMKRCGTIDEIGRLIFSILLFPWRTQRDSYCSRIAFWYTFLIFLLIVCSLL